MWLPNNKFAFSKLTNFKKKVLYKAKKIILSALLILLWQYAGAQSWLSRQWHNSLAHYNYYYNSQLLVTEAEDNTLIAYKDNFKDVLSLYPIGDAASLKGNAAKMDEVLKKCSHIIDKHSKSKWVDDSYLMMGNAQFYKGDFYAAIEVYEYVAGSYKNTIPAAKAEINLLVTYIQLKKFEDAEALYTRLSNKKDFPEKLKPQLDIAGAAINIQLKKYQVAIKLLEGAIPKFKNKPKKIRYNFVLAQLYGLMKKNNDANERYKKVVKLNPPYEFAFNAKLNMAKAINIKNRGEVRDAMATLRAMLKDDKNIDYFDQIHYELGNLELADKNENNAIAEYRAALRSKANDINIKSSAYLALADLYFKRQDYPNAQLFYDSAARSIDKASPDYNNVMAKNQVLNELIRHLINIKDKDSLLRLGDNEALREKTIDRIIEEEKRKAEEQKLLEERQKIQQQLITQNPQNTVITTNFPFYNQAARTKGLQDFQRIWGNRELAEYWGISSNKTAIYKKFNEEQETIDPGNEKKKELLADVAPERKKYYENIPFTAAEKQKLKDEIAESYFLGANVYYQDLGEADKAKKMLDELLKKYPGNKYQVNAWYLLAKIYKEKGNEEQYNYYLDLIKKADPKSNFINVLEGIGKDSANTATANADDEVEILYQKTYAAYKSKAFDKVLEYKKDNDTRFPGNPLQVNFDYLEALAIGEQGQMELFEKKLKAIADNYPDTDIGKQAANTLQIINSKKQPQTPAGSADNNGYKYDENAPHFYMLVVPVGVNINQLKTDISTYNKNQFSLDELQLTNSLLGQNYQVLIVNNFKSLAKAKEYIAQIKSTPAMFASYPQNDQFTHLLISQENFALLMQEKKLDNYLLFYKSSYPN